MKQLIFNTRSLAVPTTKYKRKHNSNNNNNKKIYATKEVRAARTYKCLLQAIPKYRQTDGHIVADNQNEADKRSEPFTNDINSLSGIVFEFYLFKIYLFLIFFI